MPPRRQRAPRLSPEVRRGQILDAALAVADEQGLAPLTVDAVARRAGITRPVVYDLFGNLAGLLEALVDDAEERALAAVADALPDLQGDPDPDVVLEQAMRTFITAARAEPALWRVMLAPAEGTPPELRVRYRRQRETVVGHIAELLGWWVARVDALADLDRTILARTMVAVFEDATRLALEHPRKYAPDRLGRAAGQFARLVPLDR